MKKSILIVDDNPVELKIAQRLINRAQSECEVHLFSSGKDVLNFLSNQVNRLSVSFILLDLNMPQKNGFETLQEIRASYSNDLKVIIFTNSSDPEDRKKSLELGANEFIVKPSGPSEYIEIIKNLL